MFLRCFSFMILREATLLFSAAPTLLFLLEIFRIAGISSYRRVESYMRRLV